jgi:hypothetical protein
MISVSYISLYHFKAMPVILLIRIPCSTCVSVYLGTCMIDLSKFQQAQQLEERMFLSEDYMGMEFTASQCCHCREPLKSSRSSSGSWNK